MKLYDGGVLIILGIIVAAAAIGFISSKHLGNDNVIEETAENVIEQHTGLDIDLSPGEDPDGGTNWMYLLSDRDM